MTKSYKDLLNLDVDSIEPMDVSNAKKTNIKNHILAKGHKKKRFIPLRRLAVAATIGIGAVTAMSLTFPTVASQLPFMDNIIHYFDKEDTIFENYDDLATDISQIQTSNGVSVMIESAVFDGTSLSISYAIETDIELGPSPYTSNSFFDIKDTSGLSGSGSLQKISDSTYVGIETITPHFNNTAPDEITVSWQPKAFKNGITNTEVTGDWRFDFTLPKLEGELQTIGQSVTEQGVTVTINSFEKNDLSTVIQYEQVVEADISEQQPYVFVQFDTVQDNLGNTYIVENNGGSSHDNGRFFKGSSTFKSPHPEATSLTLIPTIYSSRGSGIMLKTQDMKPIIIDLK